MAEKSLRNRIIDASLHLFEIQGYHGVTVDRIIEETSSSKGGFYHNFKSKDELLYFIHDEFITYALTKAKEAYETHTTSTERICTIVQFFLQVFDLYKSHITVFYQESVYLKPEYSELIKKKRKEFKQILFRVLQEGVESGEFRTELPVNITTMSIIGMINWTYKWYRKDGEMSINEITDVFTDLIIHSIVHEDRRENEQVTQFFIKNR